MKDNIHNSCRKEEINKFKSYFQVSMLLCCLKKKLYFSLNCQCFFVVLKFFSAWFSYKKKRMNNFLNSMNWIILISCYDENTVHNKWVSIIQQLIKSLVNSLIRRKREINSTNFQVKCLKFSFYTSSAN